MTEREMLEAAARAVGCAHLGAWDDGMRCLSNGEGWWFDPRNEGSDSFELAAALRISVEHNHPADNHPWVSASIDGYTPTPERACFGFMEDVPDESQRADRMRLAILRCAAAQAPNVAIDRERMEKALGSKSFTLPNGLSEGEIVDHFTRAAKEQA